MNLISIETQKKLMYIPYLNVLNYFIWYINIVRAKVPTSCCTKGFWSIIAHALPIWFVITAVGRLLPGLSILFGFCAMYFPCVAMSVAVINFHKKYLQEE